VQKKRKRAAGSNSPELTESKLLVNFNSQEAHLPVSHMFPMTPKRARRQFPTRKHANRRRNRAGPNNENTPSEVYNAPNENINVRKPAFNGGARRTRKAKTILGRLFKGWV
jgi:hypothetical protein